MLREVSYLEVSVCASTAVCRMQEPHFLWGASPVWSSNYHTNPPRQSSGPEPAFLDWYGHWDEGWACTLKCEQARGVWGHAPPGRFLKLGTLRSLLRPCLGQNATTISLLVVSVAIQMNWAARNDCLARCACSPSCALVSCSCITIEDWFSRSYFGCLKTRKSSKKTSP